MDNLSSRDLMSNLPLSIIHTILEHLPIRETVQTSVLSRQWRYKWASLPHLTFEKGCMENSRTELKDFITQFLLLHQGPILQFKLLENDYYENMHQWLVFLSRNGIKSLDVNFGYCHIPSSIYACQNLTHLGIFWLKLPPPLPSFKGFSCLKSLVIEEVMTVYSNDTFRAIFGELPLLEEFSLSSCRIVSLAINPEDKSLGGEQEVDLTINAPKLKKLFLSCGVFHIICIYAPLLSEMSAFLENFPEWSDEELSEGESPICKYTEFLGGVTGLEKLKGGGRFFEHLSLGIESYRDSLVFARLRFIEATIHKADDDENYWMKSIQCLLANSPMLKTLLLICDKPSLKHASTLLTYTRASPNAKILYG